MKKLTQNTFVYVLALCLLVAVLPVGVFANDLLSGVPVAEEKNVLEDETTTSVAETSVETTSALSETSADEEVTSATAPETTTSAETTPVETSSDAPAATEAETPTSTAPPAETTTSEEITVTTSEEITATTSEEITATTSEETAVTTSSSSVLPSNPASTEAAPPETSSEVASSEVASSEVASSEPIAPVPEESSSAEEPVLPLSAFAEEPILPLAPTVESMRTAISALTDDSANETVAELRRQFLDYPEIARQLRFSEISKLDRLYQKQVSITKNSGVADIAVDKMDIEGAALYANAGEPVSLTASNYAGPALVQPSRCDMLGQAFDLSLLINGAKPTLVAPVKVTLPAPKGASHSRLVVVHYTASSIELITPEYNSADQTVSFLTTGFSPFGFANQRASSGDGGTGEPASVTLAREAYDYWCGIRDDIKDSYRGQSFYASAYDYKANVPTVVLEALKGRNATLEIDFKGGSITLDGRRMHPIEGDRVYYTISNLCRLYEKPPKPLRSAPIEVFTTPPTTVGTLVPPPSTASVSASSATSSQGASVSEPPASAQQVTAPVQQTAQPSVVAPPAPENYRLWVIISITSATIAIISVIICICTLQTARKRF